MNWQGKRVLVTGAGGFIGSHLTERLVSLGAVTRGMVSYRSNGSWGWLDSSQVKNDVEAIAGDIRDRDSVAEAMAGIEIIFHLAALIAIPYSYRAPLSYVQTNIEGTLNVLQAARNAGADLVVHTSTSEVYGTARYIPIDEDHPLHGQSPYSASKIGADQMASAFHSSFGLPVATIRPFNTFGPRQSARAIIPTIISQALSAPAVHLGSLTPTRDFNFVDDTVDGFIKAAEIPDAVGRVINLGSGKEVSIGELADVIVESIGRNGLPILHDEQRVRPAGSEVHRLCADNQLARDILGWQPSHSLPEGLEITIQWLREHLEGYRVESYVI